MRNKLFQKFLDDTDYNTNAPSYYDDLARKQKLVQLLAEKIWNYDERLDERLEDLENVLQDYLSQWDTRVENLDDEVSHIFVTWLNDGTLEQIINNDVLGNKADKSFVDDELEKVTNQLQKIAYNTNEFGVVGDGVHDDTLALQKAINDSKNSKLYFEKNSVLKISSMMSIDLDNNVEIDGNGATILLDGNERNVIRVESTPFKTDQISALEKNQHVIQLTNIDGLEIGDGLVISTGEIFAERVGYSDHYKKGFTTKIRDIVGNAIHIDNIPYSFGGGFPITLKFYKNNSFILKNVTIINNGTDINKNSVFVQNVFGGFIENVKINNDDYAGIILSNACDFKIKDIEIGSTDTVNIALNYGVYLNGSTNVILDNLHIETERHCVTLTDRPCVNIQIVNSRLHSKNGSAVDSHSSWSYQITNCFLYGGITLGIGHLQIESSEIIFDGVGQFGISVREDVSKYFRGVAVKNCNIHVLNIIEPFYLMKLGDIYTEEVGTITIDGVNMVSNVTISTLIALRHSKLSDNFGDVVIKNSNFKGLVRNIISYYGETDNITSKGNQLKKKCHIDNNVFEKLDSITNALNLFSVFTFTNNILDGKSLLNVRPVTPSFITPATHISNNIIQQGSFYVDSIQDAYVNNNIIHYADVDSVVTRCSKATVTKNLINGAYRINFDGNDTGGFIHVGWNRRLGRIDTVCEINLPSGYINLET